MELTKAYQSFSGKWEIFLAYFKLSIQQPHFGKRELKEKDQCDVQPESLVNNIVYAFFKKNNCSVYTSFTSTALNCIDLSVFSVQC